MVKGMIIDFFTRKSYDEITTQDYKQNDQLTQEYGVYLGSLNIKHSNKLRELISQMEFMNEQINKLTLEWEQLHSEHQILLLFCLSSLEKNNQQVKNVNLLDDTIMISEDGHVWLINAQT